CGVFAPALFLRLRSSCGCALLAVALFSRSRSSRGRAVFAGRAGFAGRAVFRRCATRLTLHSPDVTFRRGFLAGVSVPLSIVESLFWLAVACCFVAQVAIVRSVLRGAPRGETLASDTRVPSPRRSVEVIWS